MNEHGAATPGNSGARVVINFDDEIIEMIFALQPIAFALWRELNWTVVMPVGRILAPAVVWANSLRRQRGDRTRMPVGTPPQAPWPELAAWCTAIALAFVCLDAATPQRYRHGQHPCEEPTAACIGRLAAYCDAGQRSFLHCSRQLGLSHCSPE